MDEEDYSGWTLRDRLELLAFDARLAGVLPRRLLGVSVLIGTAPGDDG